MKPYKQLTQTQVELWLNDPVTKSYLQCLWWSQDQVKEVLGNGGCVDFNSMEKTFSHTLVAEGQKQGYMNATCVLDQLKVHGQIDKETASLIEMPDVATILEE